MGATGYRIEYWLYDEVILLAEDVEGGEDLETMLAPYVSQLRGGGGVIAVVSETTGLVVARRAFWPAATAVPPTRRAAPEQAPGS